MRPLKYGEEMVRVPVKVPASSVAEFKVMVREFLDKRVLVKRDGVNEGVKAKNEGVKINPELISAPAKPKWMLDAEERMKRNKL